VTDWHIVTGEYPPQPGGVSDYTRSIALGLADCGDRVSVWAPPSADVDLPDAGVAVHRLPDHFGLRGLRALDAHLNRQPAPRRILVQYVPHAFGWKALNIPFCLWLRSRRRDSIWVMFHEVAFPLDRRQALSRNAMGVVTRRMASLVGRAAEQMFVSIPAWAPTLRTLTRSPAPITWLPVPSAIPVVHDEAGTAAVRAAVAPGDPDAVIVGHFGTYGAPTRPLLADAMALVMSTRCHCLLLGRDSDAAAAALSRAHPAFAGRVHGRGRLSARDVSVHLAACDLMLQPYPDGISSRRTSAMAGLAHGRPTVTTDGWLTEPIWREPASGIVLVPAGDAAALATAAAALVHDRPRRLRLGAESAALYDARFDIRHTIATLRSAGMPGTAVPDVADVVLRATP
jgi:glycosyltransferase involved in cell wall biosynthesis